MEYNTKPYREGGRLVLIHSFPKALSFENSGKYLFFFRDHNLILFFFLTKLLRSFSLITHEFECKKCIITRDNYGVQSILKHSMLPASGTDISRGIFVVFLLAWSGRVPRASGKRPNESLPSSDTTKILHPGRLTVYMDMMSKHHHITQTSPWPFKLNHFMLSQK